MLSVVTARSLEVLGLLEQPATRASAAKDSGMWLPLKLLEQVPGNPAGISHEWERSKKFWPS